MNRRNFLIGSMTATAPVLVGQESEAIGTGFIGTGNRGSHLLKLPQHTDQ